MKEETIIQILNSLTTVGEKSLDDILFIITLISVILGILSIGMVCCFITGVSEYLAYLQNPLGATLNYLITGR